MLQKQTGQWWQLCARHYARLLQHLCYFFFFLFFCVLIVLLEVFHSRRCQVVQPALSFGENSALVEGLYCITHRKFRPSISKGGIKLVQQTFQSSFQVEKSCLLQNQNRLNQSCYLSNDTLDGQTLPEVSIPTACRGDGLKYKNCSMSYMPFSFLVSVSGHRLLTKLSRLIIKNVPT